MAPKTKPEGNEERRQARRLAIQESFNLFVVIPSVQGMVRIYMRDLSRLGLSFRYEMELPLTQGQKLDLRLYVNPAFYLPLECEVMRVAGGDIGVKFLQPKSPAAQAVGFLQDFLDSAEKAGVLVV